MFELIADGGIHTLHATKADAITAARKAGAEAFEVLDDDERQVYVEYPKSRWV
jgi:hypothetical protein